MIRELVHEGECPYLADTPSLTAYRSVRPAVTALCSHHIVRGWRRFGGTTFRPVCPACDGCESLRIDLKRFAMSKSQRRTMRANSDLRIEIDRPKLSQDRLSLYDRFHAWRAGNKNWDYQPMVPTAYQSQFVEAGGDYALEARFYSGERLVCVDLFDIGEDGLSSVYCYWDPREVRRGLGTLSLLWQIKIAMHMGLSYIYLGYGVRENVSLNYKYRFSPLQILVGRPEDRDEPVWADLQRSDAITDQKKENHGD